jgi:hypothetical protein
MAEHEKDWAGHVKSSLVGIGTGMGVSEALNIAIETWGQNKLPDWMVERRAQVSALGGLGAGLYLWKRKGADYGGPAVAASIIFAVKPLLDQYLAPRLESFFEAPQQVPALASQQQEQVAATVEQPTANVVDLEGFRR